MNQNMTLVWEWEMAWHRVEQKKESGVHSHTNYMTIGKCMCTRHKLHCKNHHHHAESALTPTSYYENPLQKRHYWLFKSQLGVMDC